MAAINGNGMHALVGIIGSITGKKKSKFQDKTAYSIKLFSHRLKEANEIFNVHLQNKRKIQSDL
jgi:CheY-specific phosphatase CheX